MTTSLTHSNKPQREALPAGTPERLKEQFEFYDRGSVRHLTRFQFWKIIQIIGGSAIPIAAVLVPTGQEQLVRGITATLGALVAGIESYIQFRQFHQNWVR